MLHSVFIFLAILAAPTIGRACASCGCTLSSDWEESSTNRFKLDLRYDYINQTQLRSGTSTISPQAASQLFSNGTHQEVENFTTNNYITAAGEYSIDPSWKVSIQVPYIMRKHSTLGTASDGVTGGDDGGQYDSNNSSLGDIKILGRFQGFTEQHNFGLIFGFKLPTGRFNLTGSSTDPGNPGPVAIDRGLQPGSGTTDLVLGTYINQAMNKDWDYFGEAIFQTALNERDNYKTGNSLNLNLGLRFMGLDWLTPQIQINTRYVEHDTGANSDTISTGGTLMYLSPGLIFPVSGSGAELYAFVQLPIYQNLLGVQLTPTYTFTLGARYLF